MNKQLLLLGVLIAPTVAAGESRFTPADAVKQTALHNPTLKAAVADVQQSVELLRAEAVRFRPTLFLDATGTTNAAASLNFPSGTTRGTNQALVFGAEIQQVFSFGTVVDFRLENRNTGSQGPAYSGTNTTVTLGPGYGLSARLTLSQPLLRGAGNHVGQAQLRALRLAQTGQARNRDAVASQALSNTLLAYWELWYAQKALGIEQQARTLALRQRDEAQGKAKAGSLADADVLIHETRLAELDQSVLQAELTLREQSLTLANAIGVPSTTFHVAEAGHPTFEIEREVTVLGAASEASYTLAQQRIAVAIAQDTLRTAAEATRPRLDALAWLQTQGLGNQAVAPALDQLGTFDNVSANVGLVFELPLSTARHQAQQRAGELALDAARDRLTAMENQVRADTLTELATLDQARQSLSLAERTTEVATRTAVAQQQRFQIGTAIPIEVQTAEDSLRRAQLSVERARVNATKAQVRLANLTGRLLLLWGVDQGPDQDRPSLAGGS